MTLSLPLLCLSVFLCEPVRFIYTMKAKRLLSHTAFPLSRQNALISRLLSRNASSPHFLFSFRPSSLICSLRLSHNHYSTFVQGLRFEGPVMDVAQLSEIDEGDFIVETCVTHTLPPALTLEHGLESIKEAVQNLTLNPPCSTSGVFRFEVVVPPSAKALEWFCCQPESSKVFPLFFLSKDKDNPTFKSLYLNETRGVFGIGAAIYFNSCTASEHSSIKRYLTNELTTSTIKAFGLKDIKLSKSSMKHGTGFSYLFIPQIELNEYEGVSVLAATLAWDESFPLPFEDAVCSLEFSLRQVSMNIFPSTEKCHSKKIRSSLKTLNLSDDRTLEMVCMKVSSLAGRDSMGDITEMNDGPSYQFCFRLSSSDAVACNMLDDENEMSYIEQRCANINAVWASLIVEECCRLGLTYFCIAPGSRSSLLAVAAASHPLVSCIACFDERSLAFHAVGYARGSHLPAVVITTSGTAASNLFPAVVEASQDFVPLLLLTADRPPELQDAGANQAINQVNHFGSFVRFFFNLPPPNDRIPARMVLTTLDSAVHWATSSPSGPVQINCPFREPLENCPSIWAPSSCLKGLDFWMSSAKPFTEYINLGPSRACSNKLGQMSDILKIIQGARKGLLLIGAVHAEDEIWAIILLAKHMMWPVIADILSGLRLRMILSSFPEIEKNFLFVDHLDHVLLSDVVREWLELDVIIQIGSRITSKRVCSMLEECSPSTYIMVDKHPCRHDPSHILTHRIQCTIVEFVDSLLKCRFERKRSRQNAFLEALSHMVAWEIKFQNCSHWSLTEPQVAQVVTEALPSDSALFFGNSMPIRDADMYASNWSKYSENIATVMAKLGLPFHCTRVAGNRGASGIDGLLSTAVGYAVGCNKRVLCVIGDVSFLHDTNGLAILKERLSRKPVTVLVMNNHGGAIFSLLPGAERIEPKILDRCFYTSHNISIRWLCVAHGLKHIQVRTKKELEDTLLRSQYDDADCIVEVESSIDGNSAIHSDLKKFACQTVEHSFGILSRLAFQGSFFPTKIGKMECSLFRIQLRAPPTSVSANNYQSKFYREGYILSLYLEDGSIGLGEVAPLELHRENLQDVEEQLRCLLHVMEGAKISVSLPLLKGSFSSWIMHELGIPPSSIFPSVRCGLEMAILNAIAESHGSSLLDTFHHRIDDQENSEISSKVLICALIDSSRTPLEVAYVAKSLVEEGFTAIKIKVAKTGNVVYDAAVVQEVRKLVGRQIELRVDANRRWSYEEAIEFGFLVKDCDLQYIEEPVMDENDIIRFCDESGLPVALDETIDGIKGNPLEALAKYAHPGIAAIVIKPSVIGGFERADLVARWAQQWGKMAVISATFESGLGLSAYIQFSCYLNLQSRGICKVMNKMTTQSVAHGLGTFRWLEEDVTTNPLSIICNPLSGFVEASVDDADRLVKKFQVNKKVILRNFSGEHIHRYQLTIDSIDISNSVTVREIGQNTNDNIIVFLHGFLGDGEDWITIMKAMSGSARCISVDLPAHGGSHRQNFGVNNAMKKSIYSIELVADVLNKLIHHITPGKVTLVGYSMGARIALYMALRFYDKINGAVIISGSPGLKDEGARKLRRANDDSKARNLIDYGLEIFVDQWYSGEMWSSLRGHPHFSRVIASRSKHGDVQSIAKVLSDLSVGRQPSLWDELKCCKTSLLLVVGEKDVKFKTIARQMLSEIDHGRSNRTDPTTEIYEMIEIPDSGHAAHLENPLAVISSVSRFLVRLKKNPNPLQLALSP